LVTAYCDFARERPDFYRLLLGLWLAPSQSESMAALRPWAQRQQELCAAIFLKATADHGNMRGRHRLYALTFLGMINTLLGASLNGYLTLNQELIFKAVHQFMHGIYS
jgi:TetR/AcrR family transcriptional regulator